MSGLDPDLYTATYWARLGGTPPLSEVEGEYPTVGDLIDSEFGGRVFTISLKRKGKVQETSATEKK